jgi:hypothetical protein
MEFKKSYCESKENWEREKKERLLKMSKKEYEKFVACGMFYEFHPGCTGNYEEDMRMLKKELKGK